MRLKEEKVDTEAQESNMKLLKFYGSYCNPCKKLTSDLEQVKLAIEIESYNVEEDLDITDDYKIRSVPTTILLDDNNKEVKRWLGTFNVKEELKEYIKTC